MEAAAKDSREKMSQQPNSLVSVEDNVHQTETRSTPQLRKDIAIICHLPVSIGKLCVLYAERKATSHQCVAQGVNSHNQQQLQEKPSM